MLTANVHELDLRDVGSPVDPTFALRVTFPITIAQGSQNSAIVYFELEPGKRLGRHTDSEEEILYIVAGEGEAEVAGERAAVVAGSLAVVPALAPHQIRNTGTTTLKVVGFFAGSSVLSLFEESLIPGADQVLFIAGPNGQEIFSASPLLPGDPPQEVETTGQLAGVA
jgi:quercetin dioxygenase-like cupin family protein